MNCDGCKYKGIDRVCEACKKACNSASVSAANVELSTRNAPLEKEKGKGLDSCCFGKVRLFIHSRRHRLCDADGISAKALIDGLVNCGLLKDDSPEYVESVSYSQEKSKIEETIITIEEL